MFFEIIYDIKYKYNNNNMKHLIKNDIRNISKTDLNNFNGQIGNFSLKQ